jgi:triacylglycerol lipase
VVVLNVYSPLVHPQLINGQSDGRIPVLLIHGYHSGPEVWDDWLNKFHNDGFIAEAAYFHIDNKDDHCGSSKTHAQDLGAIIKDFKNKTHSDKINIVAHSKGGLDARMYLANDPLNDIEKLIVIGIPNQGSPMANWAKMVSSDMAPLFGEFLCAPAIYDLIPYSEATRSQINDNTKYYTIAGDWSPSLYNTFNFSYPPDDSASHQADWLPIERWGSIFINGSDDGMVPLKSAASSEFKNIGVTSDCHTNLIGIQEYNMVKNTLLSR